MCTKANSFHAIAGIHGDGAKLPEQRKLVGFLASSETVVTTSLLQPSSRQMTRCRGAFARAVEGNTRPCEVYS